MFVGQSQLGGVITSGGGFSTVFSQPTWQASAVNSFLQRTTATAGYNPAGRAMPDLSFVGVKYPSVIGGSLYNMYGTSASTPLFAAMSKFPCFGNTLVILIISSH